jgi:hypothetical protein
MSFSSWLFLSFLVAGAAAWASCRVAAQFDAHMNSSTPANDDRDHSEAQSRRALRKGQ